MTIKEALIAELDGVDATEAAIEKVLSDHALFSGGGYIAVDHGRLIDLSAVDILKKVMSRASVSEGGYSVRWDTKAIAARIAGYYAKWEMSDPGEPTISDISYLW